VAIHTNILKALLLHGIHSYCADEHEAAPEKLKRENGKERMTEMLKK